jgi:lipid-A-disaccharide synthase
LNDQPYREKMLGNYGELFKKIGKPGASARTAELIWRYASKK